MTDRKLLKKRSKFLSLVLRHKPETIGLTLDSAGWVPVKDLLAALKKHGKELSMHQLEDVVANNDKKRFAFNDKKTKIRASQGHSVDVQLEYKETSPPDILYHGTGEAALQSIFNSGLSKMARHHVHLSKDTHTAGIVGRRKGKLAVLRIDAKQMVTDGHKFYVSENGVWLTDCVPAKYITRYM